MSSIPTLTLLERKINKHVRESTEQIKGFQNELHNLKSVPKSKSQQPCSEAIKTKDVPKARKVEQISNAAAKRIEKSSVSNGLQTKAPRNSVSLSFEMRKSRKDTENDFFQKLLQHHLNDDEMTKKVKIHARSISTDSYISQSTDMDSVTTKINYNGSSMRVNCDSVKIIEFLFMDLKEKLKDFVPDGEMNFHKHQLCNNLIVSFLPLLLLGFPFSLWNPNDRR